MRTVRRYCFVCGLGHGVYWAMRARAWRGMSGSRHVPCLLFVVVGKEDELPHQWRRQSAVLGHELA